MGSCSHKYDSNTLGLDFYQWNLWRTQARCRGMICPPVAGMTFTAAKGNWSESRLHWRSISPVLRRAQFSGIIAGLRYPISGKVKSISMVFEGAGPW